MGVYYNKVLTIGPVGKYPDIHQYFLPTVCQNCKDAPCLKVCPTGATYKTEDGQILVNKEKCIGCKMCIAACPYGARSFNPESKVVEKCTLCRHLQEVDEKPACVKACCAGARFFGDIDILKAMFPRRLRLPDPKTFTRCLMSATNRRFATFFIRRRANGR